MTTVAQMIDWLKTLPQDAEVECGKEVTVGYQTYMLHREVVLEGCYVFDYTDPKWADSPVAGKVIVQLNAY